MLDKIEQVGVDQVTPETELVGKSVMANHVRLGIVLLAPAKKQHEAWLQNINCKLCMAPGNKILIKKQLG